MTENKPKFVSVSPAYTDDTDDSDNLKAVWLIIWQILAYLESEKQSRFAIRWFLLVAALVCDIAKITSARIRRGVVVVSVVQRDVGHRYREETAAEDAEDEKETGHHTGNTLVLDIGATDIRKNRKDVTASLSADGIYKPLRHS